MSLFKSASTVSLLTLASRITGLVRETMVLTVFGAGPMTDAFNVAFRIPNTFRRLFAEGAFSQAFVPSLSACKTERGVEASKIMVMHVTTVLFWVLLLVCVVGVIGAPLLVWVMASGLHDQAGSHAAAVWMTRLMFPYLGLISLVGLASGILNTWGRFALPAATPVLLNVCFILAAWLGVPWFKAWGIEPIYALAVGVMVGGVAQLVTQVYGLIRIDMMPRIGLTWSNVRTAWKNPDTRQVMRLMVPALFGVAVAQISLIINTQIASHLQAGSITWLATADRLMEFPTALLGVALGVVLMPQLASAKAANDPQKYAAMLDWGLRLVVLLTLPCAAALLTFAKPIIAGLFHYRAFEAEDVHRTSLALMGYGVGLLGLVAVKVLAPGFYASKNFKTPVKIAVVVLIFTQLLNVVLVPQLAHAALALSIGIGALFNALLLLVGLKRRGVYQFSKGWTLFLLRVLLASIALAAWLYWASGYFDWIALAAQPWMRIGLLLGILSAAAVIYFTLLWISGVKVMQLFRR